MYNVWSVKFLVEYLNIIKNSFLGFMVWTRRAIIHESSSFFESKEIEESEEERSLLPQPMTRRGSTSHHSEADVYDSATFSTRRNQELHKKHANLECII